MRLTLRTMLAYMDDVLDPADAEVLGKKIEESDFASGLLERVRGAMKKLRMDAPKLDGKGMGNDANTVAEYLDSSLPQDRVGEFERVCLESDKHLCEVAACHQILTIVLGKPAEVPPTLRERIYALGSPERTAAAHAPKPQAAASAPTVVPPPVLKANGQPAHAEPPLEVPDYLRSGRQPAIWPLVLVSAATLLFALLILRMIGRFDETHPLARLFRGQQTVAQVPVEEPSPSIAAESPATKTPDTSDTTSPAPAIVAVPVEPAAPPTVEPPAASENTIAASTSVPPASTSSTPPGDQVAIAASSAVPPPAIEPIVPAPTPETTPPTGADTLIKPATPLIAAPVRPQPMEVGRYTSDDQLLATLNAADGQWYAKEPQAILVADERMVVLPPYRPQIALPSAVQLTFAGEGALRLNEPGDNPTPTVTVEYGRFLAATAGRPGAEVALDLAGIKGVLTLLDADSVMAIKVIRFVPPGVDPVEFAGIPVIEMYNASGRASWQATEQPKVEIPSRHVHVYYGSDPPETHGPFLAPDWIDARNVKPIDRDAAIVLERLVAVDRPLTLALQEVMKDRRVELRALAARCLAVLDDFEPSLRELADPNQYSFWSGQFDALRQALSRGPETATKVQETVALLRPAQAKEIYRLLWGFSEEQVEKGAAADLVRFLEHEQMDVRVLAHLNLVSITGAWGFYRPERSPVQNRTAIQNWRDRLSKGAIVYRLPPSPLDTYKPVPPAAGAESKSGPAPMGAAR